MLWKHLRAVLMGPVVMTVVVPTVIVVTVGADPVHFGQPLVVLGVVLAAAGVGMLAWTIGLFGGVGKGTLSPSATVFRAALGRVRRHRVGPDPGGQSVVGAR